MKTNNPRKNREAKAAGQSNANASGESASTVALQAARPDSTQPDSTGAKAVAEAAVKSASAAEIETTVEEAVMEVRLGGASAVAADGSDMEGEASESESAESKLAESEPAESESIENEPETVAFSSATEMLVQSQQEVKKAKVVAARQKRAKEMEAFQKKVHARRVRRRIFLVVSGAVVVLLLALVLAFYADCWWLHDDAADIQGTWQVNGGDAEVTFTEDSIVLTDEVAYRYEIDPDRKTIRFNFGNLSGEGHYRFSLDRDQLSVADGETNAAGDIMEDVGWWINALIAQIRGYQLSPAIDADSVSFDRAQ